MRKLACALSLALFAGATAGFWLHAWTDRPIEVDEPVILVLEPGEGLRVAAQRAYRLGLVDSSRLLAWSGRMLGKASVLRAGDYEFKGPVTPRSIFATLESGKSIQYTVTLPEGGTFRHIQATLANTLRLVDDISGLNVQTALTDLGLGEGHAEGWFLPDTYHFQRGDPASSILKRSHKAMSQLLLTVWNRRAHDVPYRNQRQLLIAASIIEKESGVPADRVRISGVIARRLKRGMRLQLDPTVIYGLGEAFDGNLTRADLRTRTPYNTYLHRGLPPTPIASPSRGSVEAAAYPDKSDFLYFVSRGDGTSEFSKTLAAHREAVRKYQLGRRN